MAVVKVIFYAASFRSFFENIDDAELDRREARARDIVSNKCRGSGAGLFWIRDNDEPDWSNPFSISVDLDAEDNWPNDPTGEGLEFKVRELCEQATDFSP